MGGLRSLLRDAFDELLIVDLGGEGRGALVEENVFDIRTPVAIAFGIRKDLSDSSCSVRYLRIVGNRPEKFHQLSGLSLEDVEEAVSGGRIEALVPGGCGRGRFWREDRGPRPRRMWKRPFLAGGSRPSSPEDVEEAVSGGRIEALVPRSEAEYWSWTPLTDLFP